jgi:hypothetical protein
MFIVVFLQGDVLNLKIGSKMLSENCIDMHLSLFQRKWLHAIRCRGSDFGRRIDSQEFAACFIAANGNFQEPWITMLVLDPFT